MLTQQQSMEGIVGLLFDSTIASSKVVVVKGLKVPAQVAYSSGICECSMPVSLVIQ